MDKFLDLFNKFIILYENKLNQLAKLSIKLNKINSDYLKILNENDQLKQKFKIKQFHQLINKIPINLSDFQINKQINNIEEINPLFQQYYNLKKQIELYNELFVKFSQNKLNLEIENKILNQAKNLFPNQEIIYFYNIKTIIKNKLNSKMDLNSDDIIQIQQIINSKKFQKLQKRKLLNYESALVESEDFEKSATEIESIID